MCKVVGKFLTFLLQMGIANRDIKLENTLLMDESERPLLKLCDFGYSKDEYQGSACKTLCGELQVFSPVLRSDFSVEETMLAGCPIGCPVIRLEYSILPNCRVTARQAIARHL